MFRNRREMVYSLCVFTVVFFICINNVTLDDVKDKMSVSDPFKDLGYFNKSSARSITWAHAVNSKEKLDRYLQTDILMFEADVNMRFNRNDTIPIMAHPPHNDSDLTLEAFLKSVQQTRKGMKLDFKSILAVKPSMEVLKNIFGENSKPLWLNADILPGPGITSTSNPPVDAQTFLHLCTTIFPNATLSLGWTTGWSTEDDNEGYTQTMVDQMANICQNFQTQLITFPLRAVYVRRSWKTLKSLIDSSSRFSVTIWSAKSDVVDVDDLVWLINQLDKRRLYVDIPEELNDKLNEALTSTGHANKMCLVLCFIVTLTSLIFANLNV